MEDREFLLLIGSNIRAARADIGLSQEKLAERCGLDRTYIGGIERGERNITALKILQISRQLDLSPADLVS